MGGFTSRTVQRMFGHNVVNLEPLCGLTSRTVQRMFGHNVVNLQPRYL